jgi:hypothetical protein
MRKYLFRLYSIPFNTFLLLNCIIGYIRLSRDAKMEMLNNYKYKDWAFEKMEKQEYLRNHINLCFWILLIFLICL